MRNVARIVSALGTTVLSWLPDETPPIATAPGVLCQRATTARLSTFGRLAATMLRL